MEATPAQRLALVEALDREQKAAMEARARAPRNRARPHRQSASDRAARTTSG